VNDGRERTRKFALLLRRANHALRNGLRQSGVSSRDHNECAAIIERCYNAAGQRVQKIIGNTTYSYFYDLSGKVVAEWYGTPGGYNGWGKGYVYLGGQLVAQYADSTTHFVHKDHLGSTRLLTKLDQSVQETLDFLPYGEQLNSTSTTSHKFTGKERDAESNLDFFIARYYSSQFGRFLSPDEFTGGPVDAFSASDPLPPSPLPYADITNPQSLNKYTYTWNNPLRYTDPDGHFIDTILDVVFIAHDLVELAKNPNQENVTALALDTASAFIPFASGLGKGYKAAKALERAKQLEKAVELGKEGEKAAGIIKNTKHVDSLTNTAKFRVPDEMTKAGIREVKNVKELSLTNQIKDLLLASRKAKKKLTIVIRKDTKLSKPLQELVDKGQIKIEYLK
jgi:RHS repeat-associated protein